MTKLAERTQGIKPSVTLVIAAKAGKLRAEGVDVARGGDGGLECVIARAEFGTRGRGERDADDGRRRWRRLAVPLHERPGEQRHHHEQREGGALPESSHARRPGSP